MFSKKIKCMKCGKNFRGIKERTKEKYVCSSYSNYGTCQRHIIDQRQLVYFVVNHLEINKVKSGVGMGTSKKAKKDELVDTELKVGEIIDCVKKINIDPVNNTIEILYNDSTRTFVSDDQIYF